MGGKAVPTPQEVGIGAPCPGDTSHPGQSPPPTINKDLDRADLSTYLPRRLLPACGVFRAPRTGLLGSAPGTRVCTCKGSLLGVSLFLPCPNTLPGSVRASVFQMDLALGLQSSESLVPKLKCPAPRSTPPRVPRPLLAQAEEGRGAPAPGALREPGAGALAALAGISSPWGRPLAEVSAPLHPSASGNAVAGFSRWDLETAVSLSMPHCGAPRGVWPVQELSVQT